MKTENSMSFCIEDCEAAQLKAEVSYKNNWLHDDFVATALISFRK
jgi:hypothetical protein